MFLWIISDQPHAASADDAYPRRSIGGGCRFAGYRGGGQRFAVSGWTGSRCSLGGTDDDFPLVGSLGQFEARALVVMASHPQITPNEAVRLVFAWTQLETAPIIFGQMNFFLEFDVCFYRSQSLFDVRLKDGG